MHEINISEIPGFKIGHAQDKEGATGCTAIICEKGAKAGVDVRGGAPASRETELLNSVNFIEQIHAVMLSGGSAYGLDACAGAMQFLEEKEIGFDTGAGVVPIVCGASIFDLVVGDAKCRPDKAMGYQACQNAGRGSVKQGNVGAGTGASAGKFLGIERMMKSGLGIYAVQIGGLQCGAIVSANPLGDIYDLETGKRIIGMLSEDKKSIISTEDTMIQGVENVRNVYSGNSTIGCIITNAKVTKAQANKIASMAHNGFARSIRPVHTFADGDTIFFMSTDEVEVMPDAAGTLAAEVMGRAINNAAKYAQASYGLLAAEDYCTTTNKSID